TFETCDTHEHLEGGSGGVCRAIGSRQHRDIRIALYLFKFLFRNRRNEIVRIYRRPRSECQDFAGIRIDNNDRSALGPFLKDLFSQPLQVEVNRCDEVISRFGWISYTLPGFVAILVECEVQYARLASELVIKGLFESFPPFTLRPERIVILKDTCTFTTRAASVSDDLARNRALRIEAYISSTQSEIGGELALQLCNFIIG